MLFLARGGMPLEQIWEPWFRGVVGLVPTSLVKQQLCDSHDASALHSFECDLVNPNVSRSLCCQCFGVPVSVWPLNARRALWPTPLHALALPSYSLRCVLLTSPMF